MNDNDLAFAARTVKKTVEKGYGVVSGGARGVDSASEEAAIEEGAFAVEYLSDSMARKLRLARVTKAIRDGKLLLVSVAKPDAGFNVGIAMMRNRFIYAQSQATVVVRSDLRKGGTWAGATENLKYGWCKTLCWDNKAYKGNQELIKEGAIAISDDFDGDPMPLTPSVKQISFID